MIIQLSNAERPWGLLSAKCWAEVAKRVDMSYTLFTGHSSWDKINVAIETCALKKRFLIVDDDTLPHPDIDVSPLFVPGRGLYACADIGNIGWIIDRYDGNPWTYVNCGVMSLDHLCKEQLELCARQRVDSDNGEWEQTVVNRAFNGYKKILDQHYNVTKPIHLRGLRIDQLSRAGEIWHFNEPDRLESMQLAYSHYWGG